MKRSTAAEGDFAARGMALSATSGARAERQGKIIGEGGCWLSDPP
nr:hypothetical protein [Rhizobium rhizogenes]